MFKDILEQSFDRVHGVLKLLEGRYCLLHPNFINYLLIHIMYIVSKLKLKNGSILKKKLHLKRQEK